MDDDRDNDGMTPTVPGAMVPVRCKRQVGNRSPSWMKQHLGEGEADGSKFTICCGFSGQLEVSFEHGIENSYFIDVRDLVDSALELRRREDGVEKTMDDHQDRLRAMLVPDQQTWDLGPKDVAAIEWVLGQLDFLEETKSNLEYLRCSIAKFGGAKDLDDALFELWNQMDESRQRIVRVDVRPLNEVDERTYMRAAAKWIVSEDTGVSSETIWAVMMGVPIRRSGIPYDDDDFGRCYRLLQRIPSWRDRLHEVGRIFLEWRPVIDVWEDLEYLHRNKRIDGVCRLLQGCDR